jgi:hypothetical protein
MPLVDSQTHELVNVVLGAGYLAVCGTAEERDDHTRVMTRGTVQVMGTGELETWWLA